MHTFGRTLGLSAVKVGRPDAERRARLFISGVVVSILSWLVVAAAEMK